MSDSTGTAIEKRPATARREELAVSTDASESGTGAGSVTVLLHKALEKGASAADLKELVALHERIADREAAQEFARAMAAFQSECPSIKKESTAKITTNKGGSYEYTYAELDEIARTVNPILNKHGLSYSWDSTVEGGSLTCICTVRHVNGHERPSRFTLPVENPSAMNPQQKVGAALTFAQRRSLCAALGLTTTDEDTESVRQVDPTPITDDQATEIRDLLTESKADMDRFLAHFEIAVVAQLPAVRYAEAVAALKEKARRTGRGA